MGVPVLCDGDYDLLGIPGLDGLFVFDVFLHLLFFVTVLTI
jgi:hypothetical protein